MYCEFSLKFDCEDVACFFFCGQSFSNSGCLPQTPLVDFQPLDFLTVSTPSFQLVTSVVLQCYFLCLYFL